MAKKAGGGVIVTGDMALNKLLRTLPERLQKKLSRQATRKAAREIVLPEAKGRVPVDTGDLEDSLTVKAMKRSRTRFGHQVQTKDGLYSGEQFYGGFVEFGTKERAHKSGKEVGKVPKHSFAFMRPALYDNRQRIEAVYIAAMKEFIAELPRV